MRPMAGGPCTWSFGLTGDVLFVTNIFLRQCDLPTPATAPFRLSNWLPRGCGAAIIWEGVGCDIYCLRGLCSWSP